MSTETESSPVNVVSRDSLPASVQNWLNKSLPLDFQPSTRIQIEQEGTMEIRGRWTSFTSSGLYEASPLSFNWQARLKMLPGVWIKAEDGHREGQGWGGAQLWGFIPMGKRTDSEVLISQVVRNVGELAFLPPFALTDAALRWADAGPNAFEVRMQAADREVKVRFELNEQGDIIRASSPARPYDVPDGYAEAPWRYEFSDHRDFNGVRLPTVAVARFEKEDGPWEYFRGRIISTTFGESTF
jgi:hypothetical protein